MSVLTHFWLISVFVFVLMQSRCTEAQNLQSEKSQNGDETCKVVQKEMSLARILDIGNNAKAWVIDNTLNQCEYNKWFGYYASRIFYFVGFKYNEMHFSSKRNLSDKSHNRAPWGATVPTQRPKAIPNWKNIVKFVEKLLMNKVKVLTSDLEYFHTMDPLHPNVDRDCSKNRFVLSIFVNPMWNLNDYAQVTFYNVTDGSWEISESVHPHPFRAILRPSCHPVLYRAPCVNKFKPFKMLNFLLTTKPDDQLENPPFEMHVDDANAKFSKFQLQSPPRQVDFSRHLHKKFNDGDPSSFDNMKSTFERNFPKPKYEMVKTLYSVAPWLALVSVVCQYQEFIKYRYLICSNCEFRFRQVFVFDDLFTAEDLRRYRDTLLLFNPHIIEFDDRPIEDNDNVQWIRTLMVAEFLESGMWPPLKALCEFVSKQSGWSPYDVAINHVRYSDHTRIHPDSETHQDELTLVMYLNDDFTTSHYGETTFYVLKPNDGVHNFTGEGGELYEAIGTVAPKFGRIAIFTNNIEHSAHPPSVLYTGRRYTFALKVTKSRRLSLIKMVYENLLVLDQVPEVVQLAGPLEQGELDENENVLPTSKLEDMWSLILRTKFSNFRKHANRFLKDNKL